MNIGRPPNSWKTSQQLEGQNFPHPPTPPKKKKIPLLKPKESIILSKMGHRHMSDGGRKKKKPSYNIFDTRRAKNKKTN